MLWHSQSANAKHHDTHSDPKPEEKKQAHPLLSFFFFKYALICST